MLLLLGSPASRCYTLTGPFRAPPIHSIPSKTSFSFEASTVFPARLRFRSKHPQYSQKDFVFVRSIYSIHRKTSFSFEAFTVFLSHQSAILEADVAYRRPDYLGPGGYLWR